MKMHKPLLAAGMLALLAGGAHGALMVFNVSLSGPNEATPNASPGTGIGAVTYDTTAHTLAVNFSFGGLTSTTTAAHIHAGTAIPGMGIAGVATPTPTFAGFLSGVTAGTYSSVLDLTMVSSFNPAYVTGNGGTIPLAEAALASAMISGRSYLNIHTVAFPGGEIRGFLVPVPEASTLAAGLLLSLGSLYGVARHRRNSAV